MNESLCRYSACHRTCLIFSPLVFLSTYRPFRVPANTIMPLMRPAMLCCQVLQSHIVFSMLYKSDYLALTSATLPKTHHQTYSIISTIVFAFGNFLRCLYNQREYAIRMSDLFQVPRFV